MLVVLVVLRYRFVQQELRTASFQGHQTTSLPLHLPPLPTNHDPHHQSFRSLKAPSNLKKRSINTHFPCATGSFLYACPTCLSTHCSNFLSPVQISTLLRHNPVTHHSTCHFVTKTNFSVRHPSLPDPHLPAPHTSQSSTSTKPLRLIATHRPLRHPKPTTIHTMSKTMTNGDTSSEFLNVSASCLLYLYLILPHDSYL